MVKFVTGGQLRSSSDRGCQGGLVGLEPSAMPATGSPIEMFIETPCGRVTKTIPFPDPSMLDISSVTSGPYAGAKIVTVPIAKTVGIDAKPTMVYVDPKLTGQLKAGRSALAHGRQVFDLECVKELAIGTTNVALPEADAIGRRPAILVTDRPDACFRDERIAYGSGTLGSGGITLTGARVHAALEHVRRRARAPEDKVRSERAGRRRWTRSTRSPVEVATRVTDLAQSH
jgi:hypothetical protein